MWEELWNKNANSMIWRGLLVIGKFQKNNNGNPICPKCNNSKWYPTFFGSLDVGYKLMYKCDCGKSMIEIKARGK